MSRGAADLAGRRGWIISSKTTASRPALERRGRKRRRGVSLGGAHRGHRQLGHVLGRVRVHRPLLGLLLQQRQDQVFEAPGASSGTRLVGRGGGSCMCLMKKPVIVLGLEGSLPRDHLEHDHAERVEVGRGAGVDRA
jgi:hypothetical protein